MQQATTELSSTDKLNALGIGPGSRSAGGLVYTSTGEHIDRLRGEQVTIIGFPTGIDCRKPDERFERIVSRFKVEAPREASVEVKKEEGRVFVEVVVHVFSLRSMWELRNILAYVMQEELKVNFST